MLELLGASTHQDEDLLISIKERLVVKFQIERNLAYYLAQDICEQLTFLGITEDNLERHNYLQ